MKRKREALVRELAGLLRDLLTHNLGLKGISLMLACALWFHENLGSPETVVETFRLPLQLYNLEDHLAVELPRESRFVSVVVRGRRSDLIFKQDHIHVGVNLRNVRSPLGEVTLPVESVIPSYFDLQAIEPRNVTVTVKPQLASPSKNRSS